MDFFKKSDKQNYNLLSGYAWHVPGVGGMFVMLGWLIFGALLGNLVSVPLIMAGISAEAAQLVAYPLMFIPAMVAAKHISGKNMMFENGYKIDSNNFGHKNGWVLAVQCMLATIFASFCMELVNSVLPGMPEWLQEMMESMTQGNLLINFLCVSIMAPIFEEWLCRGTILRGLLNYERIDKNGGKVRGMKPWLAIVISAAFFALIHMNLWQAVTAFALGSLFGYVYYRTGSLKLTMLMHFANNTFALIMSNIDAFKDAESMLDVLSPAAYGCIFAISLAGLIIFIRDLSKIELKRPQGNSDEIPVNENI